jgi:hypothetical protein
MALTLTNAYLMIDDLDLSGDMTDVSLTTSADAVDVSTMGGDGWRANEGGLKTWALSASFISDDGSIDALFAKLGTKVTVEVRASADAVSVENPAYKSDGGIISEFVPIDGSVSDAKKYSISIVSAGALTMATTAV